MKTLRDYIDLVNDTFNTALAEKADPTRPASMKNINGMNVFTNDAEPANAVQTGSGGVVTSGNGAAVTSGTPAPAPDAAAAAKAKLTPSQLKWLGGADATDSAIMARMPKPLPGETVPGAAPAQAAQAAPSALPAGMTQAQVDQARNAEEPDAVQTVAPATAAANGVNAAGQNVTMAGGINPETGAPTVTTAGAPAAKPRVMAKPDPAVMKIQQDLIAKGAKIKADGVMGPATQAAQKQFAAPVQAAQKQFAAPVQAAQAAPTFAADMAARKKAANPMGLTKESRTDRVDHAFIDELNAMRSIAGIPTKNKW